MLYTGYSTSTAQGCLQRSPAHLGLRYFKKGISTISQWTGNEYKEMEKIFLGLISGAVDARVTSAACALLDFIHYARYQIHTTSSLARMQEAFDRFHTFKNVFVDLRSDRAALQTDSALKLQSDFTLIMPNRGTGRATAATRLEEEASIAWKLCAKQGVRASEKYKYILEFICK